MPRKTNDFEIATSTHTRTFRDRRENPDTNLLEYVTLRAACVSSEFTVEFEEEVILGVKDNVTKEQIQKVWDELVPKLEKMVRTEVRRIVSGKVPA